MEKDIEKAITKEFTIMGLTAQDILALVIIFSLGNILLPKWLLFSTLLLIAGFLQRVNNSGRRDYLQSVIIWSKIPKRLSMLQSEKLPNLFKE